MQESKSGGTPGLDTIAGTLRRHGCRSAHCRTRTGPRVSASYSPGRGFDPHWARIVVCEGAQDQVPALVVRQAAHELDPSTSRASAIVVVLARGPLVAEVGEFLPQPSRLALGYIQTTLERLLWVRLGRLLLRSQKWPHALVGNDALHVAAGDAACLNLRLGLAIPQTPFQVVEVAPQGDRRISSMRPSTSVNSSSGISRRVWPSFGVQSRSSIRALSVWPQDRVTTQTASGWRRRTFFQSSGVQ